MTFFSGTRLGPHETLILLGARGTVEATKRGT